MKSVKEVDGTETSTYTFTINFDRWKAIAAGLYLEFLKMKKKEDDDDEM